MDAKKVRIGGWVDKQLKADLLKYGAGTGNAAPGKKRIAQATVLANLLAEEVARRKRARRKR